MAHSVTDAYARAPYGPGHAGCIVSASTTASFVDLSAYVGRYILVQNVGGTDALIAMVPTGATAQDVTAGATIAAGKAATVKAGQAFPQFVVDSARPFLNIDMAAGTSTVEVVVM